MGPTWVFKFRLLSLLQSSLIWCFAPADLNDYLQKTVLAKACGLWLYLDPSFNSGSGIDNGFLYGSK